MSQGVWQMTGLYEHPSLALQESATN